MLWVMGLGVYQSFAKFREKFARSAAGAEIFQNMPHTAPLPALASQHPGTRSTVMYRISME
jgi:hypothetical protein